MTPITEIRVHHVALLPLRAVPRTLRIVLPGLLILLLCITAVGAADLLQRLVHFNIAAAPLASALVEFSTQSGVQVALAGSDVSDLQSGGLRGDYPVAAALRILLHDSHLSFSIVGANMVAILNTATAKRASDLPDVNVFAPPTTTEEELTADGLFQFIDHHGTTHVAAARGSFARWRGGRSESICPVTVGLDAGYDSFVSARLRALAERVGAPLDSDPHCQGSVRIFFTADPDKPMAQILKWANSRLGTRYPHQTEKLLAHSANHTIQGWYITAGGGGNILNADPGLISPLNVLPVWPLVIQTSLDPRGSRFSGIVSIFIIVDSAKIAGYSIGSIADYVAMLTLSLVQSPDHCDPLPSILDLMSSNCGVRQKPTGITAGDLAFLKALYYHNTGLGPTLSHDEIQRNMTAQLRHQD